MKVRNVYYRYFEYLVVRVIFFVTVVGGDCPNIIKVADSMTSKYLQ